MLAQDAPSWDKQQHSPLLTTWWSWSGSNRRPPECKSGALPAELQPQNPTAPSRSRLRNDRGQLDTGTASPARGHIKHNSVFQVEMPERAHYHRRSFSSGLEWNGCPLLSLRRTPAWAFADSTHVLS